MRTGVLAGCRGGTDLGRTPLRTLTVDRGCRGRGEDPASQGHRVCGWFCSWAQPGPEAHDAVVTALDKAALVRGFPAYVRCDNGPEFVARAIQDWCRQTGAQTSFIDPGSPWQNPYVESFNSRARDDLFAREIFDSILEVQVLYADWCHVYKVHRPHGALSYQPPAAFARAFSQS